jgi:hypothetical protein
MVIWEIVTLEPTLRSPLMEFHHHPLNLQNAPDAQKTCQRVVHDEHNHRADPDHCHHDAG